MEHFHAPVRRSLMDTIDWSYRLIGIKGPRGVGRTSFLLQYAKENFDVLNNCIQHNIASVKSIDSKTKALDELKGLIISSITELSAISEENAASNQEVTASVTNISSNVENIDEVTQEVLNSSDTLSELMTYFK